MGDRIPRGHACPLDPRAECPAWAGPCSSRMALDCPEVHELAPGQLPLAVDGPERLEATWRPD